MDFPSLPYDPADSGVFLDVIDVELPELDEKSLFTWLSAVAKTHDFSLRTMSYVFCSDEELYNMNVEHLDHDTLTDIITFDLRDDARDAFVEGECYISLDRIRENAAGLGVSFSNELFRVMAHGLLHLCGLSDKSSSAAEQMRVAEDAALLLWGDDQYS